MPLIAQPPPLPGGALLARLHGINAEHGYLPKEELRCAAGELGVPLSQLYSAASFAPPLVSSRVAATPFASARERPATSGAVTKSWRNWKQP